MNRIELAILANGGDKHIKEWCTCDPDVGMSPCQYCAIFSGLMYARELLKQMDESERKP